MAAMAVVAPVVAAMATLAVYPAWAPRMRPIVMGLPTYQTTASGLRFLDEQLGCSDGAVAAPGQAVRVQYSFRLLSSNAARTTWDIGASLALGSDRCGFWDEALAGMREGGRRRVLVPPSASLRPLRNQGVRDTIPNGETAVYEIELRRIERGPVAAGVQAGLLGEGSWFPALASLALFNLFLWLVLYPILVGIPPANAVA